MSPETQPSGRATPAPITSPDLRKWIESVRADLPRFESIPRRVYVVCSVNQDRGGKHGPQIVRFSNQRQISDEYRACFDKDEPMSFDRFVEVIPPRVGYVEERKPGARFSVIEPVPHGHPKAKNGDRLCRGHFLFDVSGETPLDGLEVFRRLTSRLTTVSRFLHEAPDLHVKFSHYLSLCATHEGLPAYARSMPLPPGMRELLTNLFWNERDDASVDLSFIQLEAWAPAFAHKGPRAVFRNIIAAFRDVLVGADCQHSNLRFAGGAPPDELAEEAIGKELLARFQEVRKSYKELRQILRNKAMLSMIPEWVLGAFYGLESVRVIDPEREDLRDAEVERLVLEGMEGVVAPQKPRPDASVRRAIQRDILARAREIIDAVMNGEEAALLEECGHLSEVVRALQADPRRLEALRFFESLGSTEVDRVLKGVLVDVISPALFQSPALDIYGLENLIRSDFKTAFLLAIVLDQGGGREMARQAAKLAPEVAGYIDAHGAVDVVQLLQNVESKVIGLMFAGILRPKVGERLEHFAKSASIGESLLASSQPSIVVPIAADEESLARGRMHGEDTIQGVTRSLVDRSLDSGESNGEEASELTRRVDEQVALVQEEQGISAELVPAEATSALLESESFVERIEEGLTFHQLALQHVYSSYGDGNVGYRRLVDRLTLNGLLLLDKEQLGLGSESSNLYRLLDDLVLLVDPSDGDLTEFMAEHSLTNYFEREVLEKGGVTELRQRLANQGSSNFGKIVDFVSEVGGMRYLLEALQRSPSAEVIVFHATAEEFTKYLDEANLSDRLPFGPLLRSGALVSDSKLGDQATPPALVFMADSVFDGDKESWLGSLASLELSRSGHSFVLPPILVSSGPQGDSDAWARTGERLASAALGVPTPVTILGPAPELNARRPGASIYLPAGYLLCAHLLGHREGKISLRGVPDRAHGRFRVLGRGFAPLHEELDVILDGRSDAVGDASRDVSSFASDYFLYIVLLLEATAFGRKGRAGFDPRSLYTALQYDSFAPELLRSATDILERALVGKRGREYSLEMGPDGLVAVETRERGALIHVNRDVAWFERARNGIGLRPFSSATS